ncbi:UNVERIFIED_CONTAM: hypothetical protein RMT77_007288 [Armadillidium vulgare]
MRVSPAPPHTPAGPQTSSLPHTAHISSSVGTPGNVMSPHPVSGQSENRNSSMHSPGYSPGTSPHMTGGPPTPLGYPSKISHMSAGPPGAPYGQPGYQQGPGAHQYPPTRPQGHIMQPYSQNYPPSGPQGPPGPQYPQRPPHNSHVPPNQPYPYPHFGQQGWSQGMGQPMLGSGIPGKGSPNQMPGQPSPGPPGSNNVSGTRPHYLKQHIQHKIGVYPPSSGPQMYPNGPGMTPGVVNNRESPQNNMPPPTSTPQPLTPSTPGNPNMDVEQSSQTVPSNTVSPSIGINSNSTNTNSMNSSMNNINSNPPQIGPDGNPLVDEASQQSTVSNTSAASGDDRSCTPKPHKENAVGNLTIPRSSSDVSVSAGPHPPPHTPTPLNSAPSPGTASMTSQQDEFENVNSPGWPRSPTGTPVYANSQPPPPSEIYRTTKPGDSIMRLYEMSDSPERRAWLDKLLRFMEDNKTPITACPTISKNPLDLYALYLHVKERGGFEEVTRNKHWKDVAAVMGIGASSSGSYTLRRHYMKHILAYECKFDRGGVDPQPIISQIESSQKKKTSKTLSVPSPGSNSSSMDGFSNGPHMPGAPGMAGPYSQYPPSSEFPGHLQQRPPNQSTPGYQGFQGGQFPGYQGMHSAFSPATFPGGSGYPPDSRNYQPPPPNHQGNYQGYQQPGYQRPGFPPPPPAQSSYQPDQYPMGNNGATTNYGGSQLAKQLLNPPPRNAGPVMQGFPYPPKPGSSPSPGPPVANSATSFQGQRRHPDFEKGQPGWRPPGTQFGSYGTQGPTPVSGQQPWSRSSDSGPPPGPAQWTQPRYPPPPHTFTNQSRWSSSAFGSGSSSPRAPSGSTPGSKNYMAPHATSFKSGGYGTYMGKQLFPMDSVEAVSPVLVKRKRMTRADIPPVDPWRLLMSLRCGLASEVTWALDVLNILLFDDQTVVYFGLNHMPGLLETLIEHLRRGLINMFNICSELELGKDDEATGANKRIKAEQHDYSDRPWFAQPPPSPTLELDLGKLDSDPDPSNKEILLKGGLDYTVTSRNGKPVRIIKREGKIFMKEGSREWDKWEGFDSGVDTWSVGGGECTAHIICSMQSSVPPIPFTRLIPGKQTEEEIKKEEEISPADFKPSPTAVSTPKNDKLNKCRKACVTSQCVIKIEKIDSVDAEKIISEKSSKQISVVKSESSLSHQQKSENGSQVNSCTTTSTGTQGKDNLSTTSDKCNGSKEISTKSNYSSKFSRKNNAKTSKLDAIVKRIKKEPLDSLSIFNKIDKGICQTDSRSILDHYLKKEDSVETDKKESAEVVVENASNKETSHMINNAASTNESPKNMENNKCSLNTIEVKSPVKSPSKLPSIPVSPEKKEASVKDRKNPVFKRPFDNLEEESWSPDEASLTTTTEGQDWLARRVIAVGTVLRNMSFIPGNEDVMSKSASLLALLGKTILLHHNHPVRSPTTTHYDRDEETDFSDWCSSLASDTYWWWPYLHHVHENTLVTLANMAGHLDLSYYPEEISRPILNGLLHWATCPSSYGQDTIPGGGVSSQAALSPQRLALEALVKLCVLDPNTDLVLATPPFSRLDMLCGQLTRLLCRGEDQVAREFAINLFHYFSAADSGVARVIAMQNGCVSLLVAFIEEAESAALNVANIQGVTALKENPELMGTSLDMVRRSANTLVNLSRVPDNARVIAACENRFLTLVMSQILDTYVASQLSQVLFNVAQVQSETVIVPSPPPSPEPVEESSDELKDQEETNESSAKDISPKENDIENNDRNSPTEDKEDTVESKVDETCKTGTVNSTQASPCPVFTSKPSSSSNNSSSTPSTSSSSSPMSLASHPPLSPNSLSHTSPRPETAIDSTKASSATAQATPAL